MSTEPGGHGDPVSRSESIPGRGQWAPPVQRLHPSEVPAGAINLNVSGRRVSGPVQGFGQLWRKTYEVELPAQTGGAADVVSEWKQHFGTFWPKGNTFYGPITSLVPGDVAVINMSVAGPVKLSTGVLVLYADDETFTLMCPEGHMFAGWITFSAERRPAGPLVAAVEVFVRASDPIFEAGLPIMMHRKEDRFWNGVLTALARHFGMTNTVVHMQMTLIDRHRQWRFAANVLRNAAIRTAVFQAIGLLRRRFGRRAT